MSRSTIISITKNGTVVKVIDNDKISFEVTVGENRQLKLEENLNRIIVLPHPNETALNNFVINFSELADTFGTANIKEYFEKLQELKAFKKGGGGVNADMAISDTENEAYVKNKNATKFFWATRSVEPSDDDKFLVAIGAGDKTLKLESGMPNPFAFSIVVLEGTVTIDASDVIVTDTLHNLVLNVDDKRTIFRDPNNHYIIV